MSLERVLTTVERWAHVVPLRLRSILRRRDVDRELDEELEYHVERQTAEHVRQGMFEAERLMVVGAPGVDRDRASPVVDSLFPLPHPCRADPRPGRRSHRGRSGRRGSRCDR